MASKKVSLLKFVGTVSVGLLTGVSYTLTSLAVPSLLSLPSAASASKAFHSLVQSATPHLRILPHLASGTFALAYMLSPRAVRHPYLLYASFLSLTSSWAPERLAPYLLGAAATPTPSGTSTPRSAPTPRGGAKAAAGSSRNRMMESSYEVLGDHHSEGSAASTSGGEDVEDDVTVNGEKVRAEVENWLKARVLQTGVAACAFMISVVGIWGDGAAQVLGRDIVIL